MYPTFLREIQGPGWETWTKRNDEVDALSKEGFIVSDFDRMRKEATDARRKASTGAAAAKKGIMQLETQVGIRKDQLKLAAKSGKDDRIKSARGDLDAAETELRAQCKLERHNQQSVEHTDATFAWTEQMKGRYKTIQEKLEVRFTIYLEFLSDSKVEQVVLVETNPRPSTREAKPSNQAKVGEITP